MGLLRNRVLGASRQIRGGLNASAPYTGPLYQAKSSGSAADDIYVSGEIVNAGHTNCALIFLAASAVSATSSGPCQLPDPVLIDGAYDATMYTSFTSGDMLISVWYYVNPPVTPTLFFELSYADYANHMVAAYILSDVHQTTPIRGVGTNSGTGTDVSAQIASAANSLLCDLFLTLVPTGTAPTATVGAGQTQDLNGAVGGIPYRNRWGASHKNSSAGTSTMTWTLSNSRDWAALVAEIDGV